MNDEELLTLLKYIAQDYYYKWNLSHLLPSLDIGELISWGYLGYVKGEERFDPSLGYKMSTYVQWWIRAEISGELRKCMKRKAYLDSEFSDDIGYLISYNSNPNSSACTTLSHDNYIDLNKLLSTLTKRERKYVQMRFIDGMSEREVGEKARYSKQNIDVITDKAIYKMRVRHQKLKHNNHNSIKGNVNVCNRTYATITAEENT